MCFCLECICLLFWLPPLLWRPNPLLHWCPFFSLDPTLYYLIIIQPPASWVVFIFSKFLISRNCWCLCVHYQVLDKHFHLTFNYNKLLVIENFRLGDKSEIPKNKLSAVKQVSMHQDTLQKTAWTLSKITVLTQVYVFLKSFSYSWTLIQAKINIKSPCYQQAMNAVVTYLVTYLFSTSKLELLLRCLTLEAQVKKKKSKPKTNSSHPKLI